MPDVFDVESKKMRKKVTKITKSSEESIPPVCSELYRFFIFC